MNAPHPDLPCTTCADLTRDCGTCADYGAWLRATEIAPTLCHVCVDAEWLILAGEAFEQVAARLHMAAVSLERHLHRHERRDLLPRSAHV